MTVYTDAELSAATAAVLDRARSRGEVRIERSDGQEFILHPAEPLRSPMDVPGVQTDVTLDEIIQAIHDGRARPRSPLDVGFITPRQPITANEIVALVREGRERG